MTKNNLTEHEIKRRKINFTIGAVLAVPIAAGVLEGILERNGVLSTPDNIKSGVEGLYTALGAFTGVTLSYMPFGPSGSSPSNSKKIDIGIFGVMAGGAIVGCGYAYFIQKAAKAATLALYK